MLSILKEEAAAERIEPAAYNSTSWFQHPRSEGTALPCRLSPRRLYRRISRLISFEVKTHRHIQRKLCLIEEHAEYEGRVVRSENFHGNIAYESIAVLDGRSFTSVSNHGDGIPFVDDLSDMTS